MNRLILNRGLQPADVPTMRAVELEAPGGRHSAAWREIWRFALTLDLAAYSAATRMVLDAEALLGRAREQHGCGHSVSAPFAELRAMLLALYRESSEGNSLTKDTASLTDAVLDGLLHADLCGGQPRPRTEPPPSEPGLGTFGATHGSGQQRFWFTPHLDLSRTELYDRMRACCCRRSTSRPL